jgi:hypothetical protein
VSKFSKTWGNQTEIGRRFNLSAVALGKILTDAGLRDATTKEPTPAALSDGYALATPLKNGRPFFMWNRDKIFRLLSSRGIIKASHVEAETSRVFSEMRSYLSVNYDDDKMERIVWQTLDIIFDETMDKVEKTVRQEVRIAVIQQLEKVHIIPVGTLSR